MTRCVWLDRWREYTHHLHILVVTLCVVVGNLHRLKLLKASLLCNLILALVSVVLEVTHIGNIAYIAHLITLCLKVAEEQIECNCRTGMTQVRIAIYCRTADIHTYAIRMYCLKLLLTTGKGVVECKCWFHIYLVLLLSASGFISSSSVSPNESL